MLSLAKVADAKRAAADIVAFETRLAKAQWSKEDNRDSTKTYNKKTRDELVKLRPGSIGTCTSTRSAQRPIRSSSCEQPSYFTAMAEMADSVPLGDLEGVAEVAT